MKEKADYLEKKGQRKGVGEEESSLCFEILFFFV
jgi:hypothetical protein